MAKLITLFFVLNVYLLSAYTLTKQEAEEIGRKIWKNECAGTIEGLTSWNEREEFASLGIGHFIWYPNSDQIFNETFPALIKFMLSKNIAVPAWLLKKDGQAAACPWKTRESFLKAFNSKKMNELRSFLKETIPVQTEFMIQRLHWSLPKLFGALTFFKKRAVRVQLKRLTDTPQGLYAIIDYLNFKGEGINPHEDYQGKRWGLLQVLERMKGKEPGKAALQEFAQCAEAVLVERVQHAPPERQEERWLPGWKNRLATYKAQ